jgi:hypothetical protein
VKTVYRYWAALVFLAIVVQVGFAGYGAFSVAGDTVDGVSVDEKRFEDAFTLHAVLGTLIVLGALLYVLIALAARLGGRRVGIVAGFFGLTVVQMVLAWIGGDVPAIGFFHPVNALVLFAFSGWLAQQAWRGESAAAIPPAAA